VSAKDLLRRITFGRLTEPQVLFPLIGALLLAIIWGATFEVIRLRRADAERTAVVAVREQLDTYQAQLVRVLREIDLALHVVQYCHQASGPSCRLAELQSQELLPPSLVFSVSVADRDGRIIDDTQSPDGQPPGGANVSGADYFSAQRDHDQLFIGHIPPGRTQDMPLNFSRRLQLHNAFDGVAIVSVDASYFVSDYDSTRLGDHGVIGLLGFDGVFRVRRSGETLAAGDSVNYDALVSSRRTDQTPVTVSQNSWDGIQRWTAAREVPGFPLAALLGLSTAEQATSVVRDTRAYLERAALASLLALGFVAVLGRMNWHLLQSRQRESEIKLEHATRIEYLAYHDGLTGLANRSLFGKLLAQNLANAHRQGHELAVAFLDLDRFKQINDTLGHEAGDQLLQEVARRLQGCVRSSDTVARLGGDEFVVLMPELPDGKYAATVAQKVLMAVSRPFVLIGHEFRVTASIGISVFSRDGLDEQTLTKNADAAMYRAKSEGKNNFQFYSAELNANSLERLALESSLRHGLERNEFCLHYQPKRDLRTGYISGVEALLRWEHPDLGTLPPGKFLPIAEETGLMVPIGRWALRAACRQWVAWREMGVASLTIAVNLTARQFRDEHLLTDLGSILTETDMDPHFLELEISECLLTGDMTRTLRIIQALKAMGIRIAVDDFGTGFATLTTLERFPLDTIKIDRSFVRDITSSEGLAGAVISMGKALSLTVVAQGVETHEQAEYLRLHACDELQGFYFKRPLPPEQFSQLLLEQKAGLTSRQHPPLPKTG
jgi:diguanylate cyclase (GGDEF)-like protein